MSVYEDLRIEKSDRVVTIVLDRPEQSNALSPTMQDHLLEALETLNADDEVGAIVITGAGRAFCSGGDLDEMESKGEDDAWSRRAALKHLQSVVIGIRSCEKPVIAAVNGAAVAGGCDLALACDIRLCSDTARFGEVFSRIGLFPGTGGTYLLPRVVGIQRALELIWTGDVVDATEALAIGLVSKVVSLDELRSAAHELAARLAAGPPLATALAKIAVYQSFDVSFKDALEYAATAETVTLTSVDHQEGLAAFREGRTPKFRGR